MRKIFKREVDKVDRRQSKVPREDLKHAWFSNYYFVQNTDD
jgi:hypothetical protein